MPTILILHPTLYRSCIKTSYKKECVLFDNQEKKSVQKKEKQGSLFSFSVILGNQSTLPQLYDQKAGIGFKFLLEWIDFRKS